jgi:hypothetical protein
MINVLVNPKLRSMTEINDPRFWIDESETRRVECFDGHRVICWLPFEHDDNLVWFAGVCEFHLSSVGFPGSLRKSRAYLLTPNEHALISSQRIYIGPQLLQSLNRRAYLERTPIVLFPSTSHTKSALSEGAIPFLAGYMDAVANLHSGTVVSKADIEQATGPDAFAVFAAKFLKP